MAASAATFGERLRMLRKERNMQQRELAQRFNLSPSAIGGYERGLREPEINQLLSFAQYFDVSVDYLIGRTSERRTTTDFTKAQTYEYKDFMYSHTITMNGQPISDEDKQRLCDMATGLFWTRLQEDRR